MNAYRALALKYNREAREAYAAYEASRKAVNGETVADRLQSKAERIAAMWPSIKAGMSIGNIVVAKKNAFSITSAAGNRYTVEELFGRDVAEIIRRNAQ